MNDFSVSRSSGGQFVVTEGAQQRDRGLVGAELGDAARAPLQVRLQLRAERRGQLAFQVVRQQFDYRTAAARLIALMPTQAMLTDAYDSHGLWEGMGAWTWRPEP